MGKERDTSDDLTQALTGGLPYPSFTIPLTLDPEDAGPDGGAAAEQPGAALGRVVSGTLRGILGWNPNPNDPAGFVGALDQSFDLEETEGHVISTWKKRTFAVYTDLEGGVTGAQASIYTRAKQAVDAALPLLEGLYTLATDSDPEEVAAIKALIKQHLEELVGELGRMGGPRVPRVDQFLDLLLGREETGTTFVLGEPNGAIDEPDGAMEKREKRGKHEKHEKLELEAPSADEVAGEIGRLRVELGLTLSDGRAIDVREEQNQTQFRILADYVGGMRTSWNANRRFFRRGSASPFFGTQLVHLQRMLAVIAGQVREVRFSFTSLFIGPNERQTLEVVPRWAIPRGIYRTGRPGKIPVGDASSRTYLGAKKPEDLRTILTGSSREWHVHKGEPILLEEALDWIDTFAREEGPQLIRNAGKLGVEHAFFPTAHRLKHLVSGLRRPHNLDDLPAAYQTLRIEHTLYELEKQFDGLLNAAGGIRYETDADYDEKPDEPHHHKSPNHP